MINVEILQSVKYLVDNEGRQTAVQLDLKTWNALLPLLEEVMEDNHLAQLMLETEQDELLEGDVAKEAYQSYLAEAQS